VNSANAITMVAVLIMTFPLSIASKCCTWPGFDANNLSYITSETTPALPAGHSEVGL